MILELDTEHVPGFPFQPVGNRPRAGDEYPLLRLRLRGTFTRSRMFLESNSNDTQLRNAVPVPGNRRPSNPRAFQIELLFQYFHESCNAFPCERGSYHRRYRNGHPRISRAALARIDCISALSSAIVLSCSAKSPAFLWQICFWSFISPSRTVSGRGGHPGI